MLEMLERISDYVVKGLVVITGVFVVALLISVTFAVGDRFLFHIGVFWTEELARYLYLWVSFLSAAIIVQSKGHFAVPYIMDKLLGERSKKILELVLSCIMVFLMMCLFIYGVMYADFAKMQTAAALRIKMSYVYSSLPVGVFLMMWFWLFQICRQIMELKGFTNQSGQ